MRLHSSADLYRTRITRAIVKSHDKILDNTWLVCGVRTVLSEADGIFLFSLLKILYSTYAFFRGIELEFSNLFSPSKDLYPTRGLREEFSKMSSQSFPANLCERRHSVINNRQAGARVARIRLAKQRPRAYRCVCTGGNQPASVISKSNFGIES